MGSDSVVFPEREGHWSQRCYSSQFRCVAQEKFFCIFKFLLPKDACRSSLMQFPFLTVQIVLYFSSIFTDKTLWAAEV